MNERETYQSGPEETEQGISPQWQDTEIFDMYDERRTLFRDVTRAIVEKVFGDNISPGSKILELGSGVGELSNLVPQEYKNNFVHLEKTEQYAKMQKSRRPESKTIVGEIERLPIEDASVDTVVSLSAFDTLPDLEQALSETERVLEEGGTFIHILDMQPNMHILMRELPEGKIPFPNVDNDGSLVGFQLVDKQEWERARGVIDQEKVPLFDTYVQDPMYTLGYLTEQAPHIVQDIARTVQEVEGVEKEVTPSMKETFEEKMVHSLKQKGFNNIRIENATEERDISRNEAHEKFPQTNYFEKDVGLIKGKHIADLDSELPKNKVRVNQTLHVIIATKS
jgi:ubiquinone/menaquinone biosynthesis C-methylase UbiE